MSSEEEFVPTEELVVAIQKLKKKVLNELNTLNYLHIILAQGKGDARAKDYIGAELSSDLIRYSLHKSKDVSLAASKVLRSITVHKNNKSRFTKYSAQIIENIQNCNPSTKVPLAAIIWNLSSVGSTREELVKLNVLPILINLLQDPGEVKGEALGALRNFTLDDNLFTILIRSNMIENMIAILEPMQNIEVSRILWNILDSFENLSSCPLAHEKFLKKRCLSLFSQIVQVVRDSVYIKFIISITSNIAQTEKSRQKVLKNLLNGFLHVIEATEDESIIGLINDLLPSLCEDNSKVKKVIRKAKYKNKIYQELALSIGKTLREAAECEPIRCNEITLTTELGEGSFGAVYLAEYMHTPVAVKYFKQDLSEKALKKVLAEVNVMKKLRHPNIVMLMGAAVDSSKQILLITEYVKRGDLKNCLKDIDSLAKRMRIARELARGLHWCHANNITHRDLKLENIFITENWGVKIGDFGLAIYNPSGQGWRNFRGNVKYSAPELLRERALRDFGSRVFPYGQHTDVYSFGLLWYEILTRLSPFKDKPEEYKGREGQAKYTLEGHRPKPPSKWPKELRLIMRSCWDESSSQRPLFAQILNQWDSLAEQLLLPSEDKYAKDLSRKLWKDQTKLHTFDEFKTAFINSCLLSDKMLYKDSVLLEELFKENGQVSFETFCHVVSWYGPIDRDSNCINFFTRIRDLKQKFFRGFESKEESDNALKCAYEDFQEETEFPCYFLMKYNHEEMGEFEVRYINAEGDIYTMTSFNNNGQLEINGYTLENWSKVKVFLKSKHNLSVSPKY